MKNLVVLIFFSMFFMITGCDLFDTTVTSDDTAEQLSSQEQSSDNDLSSNLSDSGYSSVQTLSAYSQIAYSMEEAYSMMTYNGQNMLASTGNDGYMLQGGVYDPAFSGSESFSAFELSGFVLASEDNQSTFGLDVDAASYTFGRKRVLDYSTLPDSQSVRTEEYLNYFTYDYPEPNNSFFAINADMAQSPFREDLQLLRVGLKGKVNIAEHPAWNLTFLIDISGSMGGRLDLVKQSLHILVDNMRVGDKISITTYASAVTTVLEPISLQDQDRETIKGMISDLQSGGGTAMGSGMVNAYTVNKLGFIADGVNRVIVCSDGDANIGATYGSDILSSIEAYVDEGIMMSTLGFGIGNYQDATMETLANKGNGNYYYIDGIQEAERIFGDKLTSTIEAIAIDAKIQVEFDQDYVESYRLLGYENRDIADELFEVDSVDAGEIGSGHTVTALYELKLTPVASVNQQLGSIRLRFQDLNGNHIEESSDIQFEDISFINQDNDFKFAAIVGEYADILRRTPHTETTLSELWNIAQSVEVNTNSERNEFYTILQKAATIE